MQIGIPPRLVDYAGVVWCITVPSGAFVARRNGVAFVTGNSGFPKGKANLKPAHEPIVLARKPGPLQPLQIDATRIGTEERTSRGMSSLGVMHDDDWKPGDVTTTASGRWPSNVLLSDPELFDEPNPYVVGSGATLTPSFREGDRHADGMFGLKEPQTGLGYDDAGGYSRFFRVPGYSQAEPPEGDPAASPSTHGGRGEYPTAFLIPKADRADREPIVRGQLEEVTGGSMEGGVDTRTGLPVQGPARANSHPTVKPTDLMRHLVRLVTPPGGTVLDCFAGSGSTILACELEGFPWIAIEQSEEYVRIMEARLNGTQRGLGLDTPLVGEPRKASHNPAGVFGHDKNASRNLDYGYGERDVFGYDPPKPRPPESVAPTRPIWSELTAVPDPSREAMQALLEQHAPIMADHPLWVERRVCNAPGCGDEDYFEHVTRLAAQDRSGEPAA